MKDLKTIEQPEPDFGSDDYYQVLGIESDATPGEIRSAYKRLANRQHPDKNDGQDEDFRLIKEAYDALANPSLRAKYDKYGRVSVEDATQVRRVISMIVNGIIDSGVDLATHDVVENIKINLENSLQNGEQEIDKRRRQLERLEKNRHRTKEELVLVVFRKNIGLLTQELENLEREIRCIDIAQFMIKGSNYKIDQPEPSAFHQQLGASTITGSTAAYRKATEPWR